LVLELMEENLSRAVQWFNVSDSVWFNRRHQRSGHLLQGVLNQSRCNGMSGEPFQISNAEFRMPNEAVWNLKFDI
jgi:hypothetical protein